MPLAENYDSVAYLEAINRPRPLPTLGIPAQTVPLWILLERKKYYYARRVPIVPGTGYFELLEKFDGSRNARLFLAFCE